MQYRKNEAEQVRFRAQRIFNVGDNYYFNTREGEVVGPFTDQSAANRGVQLYIKCVSSQNDSGIYANKIAMQGLWASTNFS